MPSQWWLPGHGAAPGPACPHRDVSSQAAGPGVPLGFAAGSRRVLKGARRVLKAGRAAGDQAAASLTCLASLLGVRAGDAGLAKAQAKLFGHQPTTRFPPWLVHAMSPPLRAEQKSQQLPLCVGCSLPKCPPYIRRCFGPRVPRAT